MKIDWVKKYPDAEIYEATTDTKFWIQIAPDTSPEGMGWVIFHKDSGFAQWGGSEKSIESCKKVAYQWVLDNLETWVVTNPRQNE
jgi:hypothetical protein